MKICQLDLLAFGPFTNVSLSFDNVQPGLHIVYGPNEAGKSSSLRALRQLLFGVPHNSGDTFFHANQNLRIGARLENAAGEPLECIRRKGRSNTLRGPDDVEVIDPMRLMEMLGGIDESTFSQRFGIDYEELRKGGEAVVQGGGDLGEILFAAGAGVADLGQVQKRMADEADELFKPRGSIQRINKALSELKEARDKIKKSQLLTSEWVAHDKALRQATRRVGEIDKQLLMQKSEKSRLERIDSALPLIAQRQRLHEQLAELADAVLLPDEFSGKRREANAELQREQQSLADAEKATAKLRQAMHQLKIPEQLLAHRTAITRLHTELGSFQKAAKDRPGLVARVEQAQQQAQTILRELGRQPSLDEAEGLRIKRAQRQKIQTLAGDCKALLGKKATADQTLRDVREEIRQFESQLSEIVAPQDVGDLSRAIQSAQKCGDLELQRDDASDLLRQLERQAGVELQKLRLWQGTLDDLERLPVPALQTIERFENDMSDVASAVEAIQQRLGEAAGQIQRLDQRLEKLRLEQDVPTEDDLWIARQQRDAGWQLVLRTWRDDAMDLETETAEFIEQFVPGSDLAHAFQASVEAADQIGDRLRREADRVADKAKLTADRQELAHRWEEQQEELKCLQEKLEALRKQWSDEWASLGIDPLSPREMRSWLGQQAALANAATVLRKQRHTVESLDYSIRSQQLALNQCLAALGQAMPKDDEKLEALLARCEVAFNEIQSADRRREDLGEHLQKLRAKLTPTERDAELASRLVDQWRIDWAATVDLLGLDRDAEPLEANSVIEAIDELLAHIKDVDETRVRIEGIDHEAEEFKTKVKRLLSHGATDLLDMPEDQAVADLYDRLETASNEQTKLESWSEQLQQEETKREQAVSKTQHWQTTITTLCQEAGCNSPNELLEAEQRSAKRKALENELSAVDQQLAGLAGGVALDMFVADATQRDADQVKAMIDGLSDDVGQLEQEKLEVSETIGAERTELRRMDGSGAGSRSSGTGRTLVGPPPQRCRAIRSIAARIVVVASFDRTLSRGKSGTGIAAGQ